MKAVTVRELKQELKDRPHEELMEFCLRLSKFKKENKELLTYLLFEASDEEGYITSVKNEIDEQFDDINTRTYYFIKKGIRKVLRNVRKYIRYSQNKETEVALLIYFCQKLNAFQPPIRKSVMLRNLYDRQLVAIRKKIGSLHEDLQFDYGRDLEELG